MIVPIGSIIKYRAFLESDDGRLVDNAICKVFPVPLWWRKGGGPGEIAIKPLYFNLNQEYSYYPYYVTSVNHRAIEMVKLPPQKRPQLQETVVRGGEILS